MSELQAFDLAHLQRVVAEALMQAKTCGASAAEVGISVECGFSLNVRKGEIETLEHHNDRGMAITVYKGRRKGSASAGDLSRDAVQAAVQKACSIAALTAADEYADLADAQRMAVQYPNLDLYHPWRISIEEALELAQQTEAAALAHDKRITNSEGAEVSTLSGAIVYGNTHDFIGAYPLSRHALSCSVIASDNAGVMQRDSWYSLGRAAEDLQAAADIGREAATRALRRLDARKLSTRRAPVLFVPEMVRSLLGHFIAAVRGSAIYRQASFLLDRKGEKIFPAFVRIHEQPHLPRALGSAPFDGEGVATYARDIVHAGVLQDYVLDSYAARKLKLHSTANAGGVHNLCLDASYAGGFSALLEKMHTGLVVTELMGQGVNTVTGDYSRGASGFWVEGGELCYPVEEITIAGNLADMFGGILAVGEDVDMRSNIRCGSLLLDSMTIGGT